MVGAGWCPTRALPDASDGIAVTRLQIPIGRRRRNRHGFYGNRRPGRVVPFSPAVDGIDFLWRLSMTGVSVEWSEGLSEAIDALVWAASLDCWVTAGFISS